MMSNAVRRFVVLNSKGGCGKTTVATNLASLMAADGARVALFDYDPQGSSLRWLGQRSELFAPVQGIDARATQAGVTRSYQLRVPAGTDCVVVDTPASLKRLDLDTLLRGADAVLVPVLPSAIDLHVTGDFLATLGDMLRTSGRPLSVGLVANRVRLNTRAYAELVRAAGLWRRPLVATLRDTMYYPEAASAGLGVHELPGAVTRRDREQWLALRDWLKTGQLADSAGSAQPMQAVAAG